MLRAFVDGEGGVNESEDVGSNDGSAHGVACVDW